MGFFMLSYMSCLYVLYINCLLVLSFANISSHSVCCLFILFMVSFSVQELLSLIRSPFVYFCFYFLCFRRSKKKHCCNFVSGCSAYVFLCEFYSIRSYIPVFNPFWLYFCIWYEKMFWFNSFIYNCSVFPTPLIEETVFFPLYILPSFVIE